MFISLSVLLCCSFKPNVCGLKFLLRLPVWAVRYLLYSTDPHIPMRAVLGYWWSLSFFKVLLNRRHLDNKTSLPLLEEEIRDASDTRLAALFVKCLRMLLGIVCRLHILQLSFATVFFDGKAQKQHKTVCNYFKGCGRRQTWNLKPPFNGQPRNAARL